MEEQSMRSIRIGKITLNLGAGKNEELLKKGLVLLQKITLGNPVKTVTKKRIPGWGLRPGLAIGCKVTVRNNTEELLKRLLAAKGHRLPADSFDSYGNFSFGIPEYIDIAGLEYDPQLKIIGLEAAITLERPGYRIRWRRIRPQKVGRRHRITKPEAIEFVRHLGVEVTA